MGHSKTLVSIGIPTYNSASYIIETLESVLAQAYRPIELIIIDDGSTDNTAELVEQWMSDKTDWVKFEKNHQNRGLVATCNRIFPLCNGDLYQLLGADDLLFPEKISTQVDYLLATGPEVAMVYSNVQVIDESGNLIEADYFLERGFDYASANEADITGKLLNENFIPAPGVLVKTSHLREFMPYDESLGFEDYDIWLKFSSKYKLACLPNVLASYRRRKNSMMHDMASRYNMMHSSLKCMLNMRGMKPEWDRLINDKIYQLTPALFRYGHKESTYWVREMWRVKKTFKSFVYLFLGRINYRFSVK